MALTPEQKAFLDKLGKDAGGGDLSADFIKASKKAIADRMYAASEKGNEELKTHIEEILSDPFLQQIGCRPAYAPPKGREGAAKKVAQEYGGDWYDLKDVVRATIIAPFGFTTVVQDKIRKHFRLGLKPGLNIIKDIEVNSASDPCGYSGMNFVVRLSNHRPAEIQVNIPVMIFGKEKEADSKGILGNKQFYDLRGKFMIEGGYGHALYEIYRDRPGTYRDKDGIFHSVRQQAAYLSRRYYDLLRHRGVPHAQTAGGLGLEISSFIRDPSGYSTKTDSAFMSQATRGRR
jgi:hypothetical protein